MLLCWLYITNPSKQAERKYKEMNFIRPSRCIYLFYIQSLLIFCLCVDQQHNADNPREQNVRPYGLSDVFISCESLQTGPCVHKPRCRWKAQQQRQRDQQMAPIVSFICHWLMSTCFHVSSIAGTRAQSLDGMSEASFGHSLSLAQFRHCKHPLSDGDVAA